MRKRDGFGRITMRLLIEKESIYLSESYNSAIREFLRMKQRMGHMLDLTGTYIEFIRVDVELGHRRD